MQARIVKGIRGLVAKEISVCPRILESLVAFSASLAHGKRNRTIGAKLLGMPDQLAKKIVVKIRILSALENKAFKTKLRAHFHAVKYFCKGQSVSFAL
jgi:hypothetical protein